MPSQKQKRPRQQKDMERPVMSDATKAALKIPSDTFQYQSVIESLHEGFFINTTDGVFTFANQALAQMLGKKKASELIGKKFTDFVEPTPRAQIRQLFADTLKNSTPTRELVVPIQRNTKELIFVQIRPVTLFDSHRNIIGLSGIVSDLTERVNTENQLKLFQHGFENSPNPRVLVEYNNKKPIIKKVNQSFLKFYGYTREEVLGKNPSILQSGLQSQGYYRKMWSTILDSKTGTWRDDIVNKKKDGTLVNLILTISTVFDRKQRPAFFLAEHVNISEIIRTQAALKEKDQLLDTILKNTHDIVILQDRDGRYQYYNSSASFGLSESEVIGKMPYDFFDAKTATEIMAKHQSVVRTGKEVAYDSLVHWQKQDLWFNNFLYPVRDMDGNIVSVGTIGHNITERKRFELAMNALHESTANVSGERFFQKLTQTISRVLGFRYVMLLELSGIKNTHATSIAFWNSEDFSSVRFDITGTPCEKVKQKGFTLYLRDVQKLFPKARLLFELHVSSYIGTPLFDQEGTISGLLIVMDVNPIENPDPIRTIFNLFSVRCSMELERMRSEKALRESEHWLQESQRVSMVGSYVLNIPEKTWTSSQMLDDIFGIDQNFRRSIDNWAIIIHPKHRQEMVAYFQNEVIGKKQSFDRQYLIVRQNDQQTRWVHGRGKLIFDDTGNLTKMIGTIQDITERKEVEETLRESEERWRTIVENEPECVKLLDREGRLIEMNPAGLNMIQATFEQVRGQKVVDLVAKEDQAAFKKMVTDVFRGKSRHLVFGMVGLQGRRLTLETTSVPLKDSIGKIKSLLGVTRDITENKKSENVLREQREMYNALVQSSPDCIKLFDLQGKLKFINNAGLAEHRMKSVAEAVRRGVVETIDPNDQPKFVKALAAAKRGKTTTIEIHHTKQGSTRDFCLETMVPVKNERGNITAIFGVSRDISDQKQAEKICRVQSGELQSTAQRNAQQLTEIARLKKQISQMEAKIKKLPT